MGGKSSRDKGLNFERQIARELRELGYDAKRGFQTRGGTAEEPDVKGVGRLYIECKAHKKVNRQAAWIQAFEGAKAGNVPVAICKDDYQHPVVVLPLGALHEGIYPEGGAVAEIYFNDPSNTPLVEIRWDYFKQYLLDDLAREPEPGRVSMCSCHAGEYQACSEHDLGQESLSDVADYAEALGDLDYAKHLRNKAKEEA